MVRCSTWGYHAPWGRCRGHRRVPVAGRASSAGGGSSGRGRRRGLHGVGHGAMALVRAIAAMSARRERVPSNRSGLTRRRWWHRAQGRGQPCRRRRPCICVRGCDRSCVVAVLELPPDINAGRLYTWPRRPVSGSGVSRTHIPYLPHRSKMSPATPTNTHAHKGKALPTSTEAAQPTPVPETTARAPAGNPCPGLRGRGSSADRLPPPLHRC